MMALMEETAQANGRMDALLETLEGMPDEPLPREFPYHEPEPERNEAEEAGMEADNPMAAFPGLNFGPAGVLGQ